ncbi:MAG: TMEM165/GDT1 family protein [Candidatus Omnitrophota bacterium]|jgi:putative Ca2+/H+ antiporter (TMEM165/GDT1 family)|nr:MAG: TMEM165/GDT1 family protein [Candidatus Omnitrophota bacterium]
MDWKIFFATFTAVFLAELADKTQLVGIAMSAKSNKPLFVWLGSVSAYMIVTAVSVILGVSFGKYLRPELIKYIGASLFIIIGCLMFLGKI